MYNVIAIGDAVVDTHLVVDHANLECDKLDHGCKICFDYGAKIPINDSFQAIGGNAANVAAGLNNLGLKATLITTVGADVNGEFVQKELRAKKIDTDLVSVDSSSKTRYSTILNFKGERTVFSYHHKRKYAWPKTVPSTDWIYYTSLSEGFENIQDKLLAFLEKHHTVKLAVNPGSFQLKNSFEKILEIVGHADILIVNLQEAERLAGTTLEKEKSMATIVHELLRLGAKEVVITDGKNGAWSGNDEQIWFQEIFPVKVVAKTGAGDAFSSGYLAARFYEHDLAQALRWGTANSAGVVSQFGSQTGLLDKNAALKMIKKFESLSPKLVA